MKNFASTMISVAASLALLVSLGACSSNGGKYKAGTYTSSAKGRNGDVEVTVTVTSSKIKERQNNAKRVSELGKERQNECK